MANMSDGKTDGIVLMYCKDGVIYPVALKEEQFQMLDLTIGMAFHDDKLVVISNKPQGRIDKVL